MRLMNDTALLSSVARVSRAGGSGYADEFGVLQPHRAYSPRVPRCPEKGMDIAYP